MIYELTATLKTLKREGLGAFIQKLRIYLRDLLAGVCFLFHKNFPASTPNELVDYSFNSHWGLISPSQVRSEIVGLLELIQTKKPKTVVEIGTANGGTLFLFCKLADPGGKIISIDLPNGIHGGGYPFWKKILYQKFISTHQTIHLIRANSSDPATVSQLRTLLGPATIDLLFIDGDHTYNGVKADFENYSPLVSKEGMVVFHDICKHPPDWNCQVDVFWKEVSTQFRHQEFIKNPDQGWGGIGVLHFDKQLQQPLGS